MRRTLTTDFGPASQGPGNLGASRRASSRFVLLASRTFFLQISPSGRRVEPLRWIMVSRFTLSNRLLSVPPWPILAPASVFGTTRKCLRIESILSYSKHWPKYFLLAKKSIFCVSLLFRFLWVGGKCGRSLVTCLSPRQALESSEMSDSRRVSARLSMWRRVAA